MPPTNHLELTDCIKHLRAAAPEQYRQFREAFARYYEEKVSRLVMSEGELKVLQGHAQQCAAILQFLIDGERHG
jgi:hypothetical protein